VCPARPEAGTRRTKQSLLTTNYELKSPSRRPTINPTKKSSLFEVPYTLTTTDCSNLNSGNSRCGHEFGTQLSPDEKKELLEYLKTL